MRSRYPDRKENTKNHKTGKKVSKNKKQYQSVLTF